MMQHHNLIRKIISVKKILLTLLSLYTATSMAQTPIINRLTGIGSAYYSGDGGPATAANVHGPIGVTTDKWGNVYIADQSNDRIRKIDTSGIITTIAGTGTSGFTGDGGAATAAQIYYPYGLDVDTAGNVFMIANGRVRKVDASGTISTIAGGGSGGDGIQATASSLYGATDVKVDAAGNIYIAESGNSKIRMVNTAGIISTIAGTGTAGFSGDGGAATAAKLDNPFGLCVKNGNIYIADMLNVRVRMINSSGVISTIAGSGSYGFSGDGGPATAADLTDLRYIDIDSCNNIYFSDGHNNRIRKITAAGIISTVVGTGGGTGGGDGGPATASNIGAPMGVNVDKNGDLILADYGNDKVRKVYQNLTSVSAVTGHDTVCQGAAIALNDATLYGYWTSGNPSIATVDSAGIVAGISGGVVSIHYSYSNICSTPLILSDSLIVRVDPLPPMPVISGVHNVCIGSGITLTSTLTGGSWVSATPWIASVTSAGVVGGSTPGTAIISYALTNS
jgi:sugar lactone lactonase YvrE